MNALLTLRIDLQEQHAEPHSLSAPDSGHRECLQAQLRAGFPPGAAGLCDAAHRAAAGDGQQLGHRERCNGGPARPPPMHPEGRGELAPPVFFMMRP